MPLLTPADDLPHPPRRVIVAGTSGSGKTTLAARIAVVAGLPHVEIDALFHGPGWTPRPAFEAEVEHFSAQPGWVTEWQYSQVRPMLAARADLAVWLDLPVRTTMRQVVWRTVRRRLRREELWNGNVEPPFHHILTEQDYVVRWAWSSRHRTRERVDALLQEIPTLPIVRLRSHAEAGQWLVGPLSGAVSPRHP